jgi:predicted TIM-barrel fold metal-dependent hydrolase
MREHFWYTTQPMEEPEHPKHLLDVIEWIGADRLMFSTDYPHWDFDDPRQAFKVRLSDELDQAIFRDNAKAVFRLT